MSGFWHGANWTFIIWGALNAIYFLPLLLTNNNRKNLGVVAEGKLLPSFRELFAMLTTFILTVFAWIFFRAENIVTLLIILERIFSESILSMPVFFDKKLIICLFLFLVIEWLGRKDKFAIEFVLFKIKKPFRILFYYLLINLIAYNFINSSINEFIYFQF